MWYAEMDVLGHCMRAENPHHHQQVVILVEPSVLNLKASGTRNKHPRLWLTLATTYKYGTEDI